MSTLRTISCILGVFGLSACSVWSNASRKYLDKSAYDLAGLKVRESFVGCAEPVADSSWSESVPTEDGVGVATRDFEGAFELRVVRSTRFDACDYRFGSEADRADLTTTAVRDARNQP